MIFRQIAPQMQQMKAMSATVKHQLRIIAAPRYFSLSKNCQLAQEKSWGRTENCQNFYGKFEFSLFDNSIFSCGHIFAIFCLILHEHFFFYLTLFVEILVTFCHYFVHLLSIFDKYFLDNFVFFCKIWWF